MTYGFICPNCRRKEDITMPITQYTLEGHFCPECNTEMQRDVSTMGCMSIDKTGDFLPACKLEKSEIGGLAKCTTKINVEKEDTTPEDAKED